MRILDKITLRSIIALSAIYTLIAIVIYILLRSDIAINISGSIDISQIVTVFLTLVSVVIGWLFGREAGGGR